MEIDFFACQGMAWNLQKVSIPGLISQKILVLKYCRRHSNKTRKAYLTLSYFYLADKIVFGTVIKPLEINEK